MDTFNFYFIEIKLIAEEGGIENFPQHYRGYLKKIQIHKGGGDMKKKEKNFNFSPILPPPINNERSLTEYIINIKT